MPTRSPIALAGLMLVSLGLLVLTTVPPVPPAARNLPVAFLRAETDWADSTLARLSVEEKLGQLLLLQWPDSLGDDSLSTLLRRYQPGGLLLAAGHPHHLMRQVQLGQQQSAHPLLMGLCQGPYHPQLLQLPPGLGLGAIQDDSLLIRSARLMARQAQALGLQWLSLPALTPGYPADQAQQLPQRVNLITRLWQSRGLLAGQGPVYPFLPVMGDTARYDSLLRPYRTLLQAGPASWTLGLRPAPRYRGYPDPISAVARGQLSFQGLVIGQVPDQTRDMTGSLRQLLRQGVELLTVTPDQLAPLQAALSQLYRNGELDDRRLDRQVRRLLLAKTWSGAHRRPQPDTSYWQSPRWAEQVAQAQFELRAHSQGVIRDPAGQVPLGPLRGRAPHLLTLGKPLPHLLDQLRAYGPASRSVLPLGQADTLPALPVASLRRFDPVLLVLTQQTAQLLAGRAFRRSLNELARSTPVVLVNLGPPQRLANWPKRVSLVQAYGVDSLSQRLVAQLLMGGLPSRGRLPLALGEGLALGQKEAHTATRLSYVPPQLAGFDPQRLRRLDTIAWAAIRDFAMPGCQVLVARRGQVVWQHAYGHHTYAKRRPVDMTDLYDLASMTKIAATTLATMHMVDAGKLRLTDSLGAYFHDPYVWIDTAFYRDTQLVVLDTLPAPTEADSMLAQFDSLMQTPDLQIEDLGATPDAPRLPVVRVSQTRGQQRPPDAIDTLYLGADSLQIVRSWSLGKRRIRSRLFDVSLAELLTHHSGLSAAMPVLPYLRYRKRGAPRFGRYFQPRADSLYSVEVADHFYLRHDYLDSIWEATKRMHVAPEKPYMYSDANMVLMQRVIDSVNGVSLDSFLRMNFYEPLGMQQTGFHPLRWADETRIAPTENDQRWRYQLLRGHVHDETAALLGGVAGNAGLFANANDLGHLFQMLLNGGTYGGARYLDARIVRQFTRRQAGHRGFGFDLPPRNGDYLIGRLASKESYGHLGYTGTCVWVDPEADLIFIFLSNRVHPTNRWRLNELEVRERMHDAVYQAMVPD